ncbi:SRPBCC family protein [Leptospira idonii]|uniref:SRPBCC domain-containing protein n=1 Tax=Leptospira idonii TaxID=1193500 RepID=A0A4R9LXU4_9LEPT|nr:SRPBCC domain-containing protein [Leptospira idonii]TGN19153.1 SRPBCC domain-containing protein [Leptospira idonii]
MKTSVKVILGIVIALFLFVIVARKTSSTVTVSRTFQAPSDRVWFVWTDTESMKQWWSPKDFTAPVIQNDFKVGGKFLLSMKSPDGEMFWNSGTYKEIIPGKKIVSVMSFSDESGKIIPGSEVKVPGDWPDEIQATVEFQEVEGKTSVSIEEVGIPLIMKLMAKMGWEQQFDKLEVLLAK